MTSLGHNKNRLFHSIFTKKRLNIFLIHLVYNQGSIGMPMKSRPKLAILKSRSWSTSWNLPGCQPWFWTEFWNLIEILTEFWNLHWRYLDMRYIKIIKMRWKSLAWKNFLQNKTVSGIFNFDILHFFRSLHRYNYLYKYKYKYKFKYKYKYKTFSWCKKTHLLQHSYILP